MGMTIRHVVLVSAVLSVGSFVYMVGFSPMDEGVYGRAGAIDRTPSRGRLIITIRQAMAMGQLRTADRMADVLILHNPEEPEAYFWRGTVHEQMGDRRMALNSWVRLDEFLEGLKSWPERYTAAQLDYYRGWGKFGLGRVEESQVIFQGVADEIEARSVNAKGEVMNVGTLYNLACYRAMSGEISVAMGHWERAIELGYVSESGWWTVDPDLKPLHGDVRFWEIGATMNQDGRDRNEDE